MKSVKRLFRRRFTLFHCGIVLGLAAFGLTLVEGSAYAATGPESSAAMKAEIASGYGKLPLAFEANRGQTDAQVQFLARGRGYALFLTADGAVLSLAKPVAAAAASGPSRSTPSAPATEGAVLAMQFPGANPEPRVTGRDALAGHVNYLRANDPQRWQTEVPTFAKVAYESLYPGIDLVYYGNQGSLEYDFVVAPGADPAAVRLAFRGAGSLAIDDAGELVLATGGGEVRMHAPVLYQEEAGVRTPVAGGYVLTSAQEVGFTVAAYDPARPLVIDPVLAYSTYLGGSDYDEGSGIAVDLLGNAYVTGYTRSSDFPATANAVQASFAGVVDAFVAKLDRTGSRLLYSTYLSGSSGAFGRGIAVDLLGNAYVTGATSSSDFPATANAAQGSLAGANDAFVAKLDRTGSRLLYSTYLGGDSGEIGYGIAVDLLGNTYVTGETYSSNFPTAKPLMGYAGDADAFVAKLTPTGRLLSSTFLGGSSLDRGYGIGVDLVGNAYVTGSTYSSDFPTANALQGSLAGGVDAFVAKLKGSRLLYSTYLGGDSYEIGNGIAVDLLGNAFITGETYSSDFPVVNAVQPMLAGPSDAFIVKLDSAGRRLLSSTYLGGTGYDEGRGIAIDLRGNAYVTGGTYSSNFPTIRSLQPCLDPDAFAAKLRGGRLLFSTCIGGSHNYLGGTGDDIGSGIAVDLRGNAYVTGLTYSSDFPTTVNAIQPAPPGGRIRIVNAFVAKLARP